MPHGGTKKGLVAFELLHIRISGFGLPGIGDLPGFNILVPRTYRLHKVPVFFAAAIAAVVRLSLLFN